LGDLKSEEEACHAILQNQSFAVGSVARSVSRRLAGIAARTENVRKELEAVQDRVRIENLRIEKVAEWRDKSIELQDEAELAELTEEAVSFKIHASG